MASMLLGVNAQLPALHLYIKRFDDTKGCVHYIRIIRFKLHKSILFPAGDILWYNILSLYKEDSAMGRMNLLNNIVNPANNQVEGFCVVKSVAIKSNVKGSDYLDMILADAGG